MHYKKLVKIWESVFEKLGYRKSKPNNWVAETEELIIILRVTVQEVEKDFHIDIGIMFKKLHSNASLKAPVLEDLDIGQGLYNILSDMGALKYYLNNLFCYDPYINSDTEVTNNISEIGMLFRKKVNPYIEQLDTYAWLGEDFEKAVTWKPFLRYFRPSEDHNWYFCGKLEMYYRQP